ncbi:MAG: hypothetical protein VX000_18670, partial [Myxococcota bacterium]|nr:hypothetical protein [Myxococcota bacterium]
MTRRDTIALTLLLLACFGLAIFVRASAAGTVSTGSYSLGQYLAAMAVLRGGEPFVPNPEGGHALWAWVLPLVAVAPSLTGLIELRMVQAALLAPVSAAAAWVLAGHGDESDGAGGRRAAAGAGAGVTLALDPGLVDTLQVAFRGYAAPEFLGFTMLFGVLALRGRAWALPAATLFLVGASGQHPLATGAALGALLALPWLRHAVGLKPVLVSCAVGLLAVVPRLAHVAAVADCGLGAAACLGAVATGSAEPHVSSWDLLLRAAHDRVMVEGPAVWLPLLAGLMLALLPGRAFSHQRAAAVFVVGASLGMALVGLSIDTFRPYHLRIVAAPLAIVAAAGLSRARPLGVLLALAAAYAWGLQRPVGPGAGGAGADVLGAAIAQQDGPVRVDGMWLQSPVGAEPAPAVLSAVLQGADPEQLSLAPGTPV